MLTSSVSRTFIGLLLAAIPACGDSTAPGNPGSTYILERVEDDPLPTVLYQNFYGTVLVFSQTLRLQPGGTGTLSALTEMVPHQIDEPRDGPESSEASFHWTQVDGRIEIEYDCPPNANCVAGPHLIARVRGSQLAATLGPQMLGRAPLFYAEAAAP